MRRPSSSRTCFSFWYIWKEGTETNRGLAQLAWRPQGTHTVETGGALGGGSGRRACLDSQSPPEGHRGYSCPPSPRGKAVWAGGQGSLEDSLGCGGRGTEEGEGSCGRGRRTELGDAGVDSAWDGWGTGHVPRGLINEKVLCLLEWDCLTASAV